MTQQHMRIGRLGAGQEPQPEAPRHTYASIKKLYDQDRHGRPGAHARAMRNPKGENAAQWHMPLWMKYGSIVVGSLVVAPLALTAIQHQGVEDKGTTYSLDLGSPEKGNPELPVPNGKETEFTFKPGTERSVVYCAQRFYGNDGNEVSNALVSPGTYDDQFWHRANVELKGTEITVGWTQDTQTINAGVWQSATGKPGETVANPDGMKCWQTTARAEVHRTVGGTNELVLVDTLNPHPQPDAVLDLTKPIPGVIDQRFPAQ